MYPVKRSVDPVHLVDEYAILVFLEKADTNSAGVIKHAWVHSNFSENSRSFQADVILPV